MPLVLRGRHLACLAAVPPCVVPQTDLVAGGILLDLQFQEQVAENLQHLEEVVQERVSPSLPLEDLLSAGQPLVGLPLEDPPSVDLSWACLQEVTVVETSVGASEVTVVMGASGAGPLLREEVPGNVVEV